MPDFVTNIFAFIIGLGFLIFAHEAGHFMVAKLFRVRVLEIGTHPIESAVRVGHQAGGHHQRDQLDRGIHEPEHRGVVAGSERAHEPLDLRHVGSDRNRGHLGTSLSMSRSA